MYVYICVYINVGGYNITTKGPLGTGSLLMLPHFSFTCSIFVNFVLRFANCQSESADGNAKFNPRCGGCEVSQWVERSPVHRGSCKTSGWCLISLMTQMVVVCHRQDVQDSIQRSMGQFRLKPADFCKLLATIWTLNPYDMLSRMFSMLHRKVAGGKLLWVNSMLGSLKWK